MTEECEEYQQCAERHYGPWCIEPAWLQEAITLIKAGAWQSRSVSKEVEQSLYRVLDSGIAYVPVMGQITKGDSKYGGVSSLALRSALREIRADPKIRAAVLHIDSPGGTYAGTAELANAVDRLANEKWVVAAIEDLGASAAYWVASQAMRIYATPTSEVGSIGTYAVITDSSGAAAAEGLKVHVISTGPYKGVGEPGVPVTDEHLAYLKTRLSELNEHFLAAVANGRQVSREKVDTWADGRVHIAAHAKDIGLIDEIGNVTDAVRYLEGLMAIEDSRKRSIGGKIAIETLRVAESRK